MALLTESVCIDSLLILITFFVSIKLYFNWAFNYWSRRGVSVLSPSFPLGNVGDFILQKMSIGDANRNFYQKAKAKGLKYCGLYSLTKPGLIVIDPELLKTILTKDFQHFNDRGFYVNKNLNPLSSQLLTLSGTEWRKRRAEISPTFTSSKMKMMFETLLDCSKGLGVVMDDAIENSKPLDIKEILQRFTIDVIGSCGFGVECNSLEDPNSQFRKYGKKAFSEDAWDQFKRILATLAPVLLDIFRLPVTDTAVTRFFVDTVKETIRYREENNIVRKDFMHLMIQLKNTGKVEADDKIGELKPKGLENRVSLTEVEIAAEAFLFFTAGFETTATTLTFCFYELASNMDIQEALRNEIRKTLMEHEGKLSYNALVEMTYMDKCINETLRKYPPIPVTVRNCIETYKIPNSNVIIEKGIRITIPILGIHYDPEHYLDPEKFDPERFSLEEKSRRHPYAWIPFGEGPRICVGMRFALMQIKVALAVLLKDYRFSLNLKTKTPVTFDTASFFLLAKGGIWLNAERIN